jgi:hypothetical protein
MANHEQGEELERGIHSYQKIEPGKRYPPVEAAFATKDGKMWLWCGHCQSWHEHRGGEGLYAAKCTRPSSPYADTGYYLRQWGPTRNSVPQDPEAISALIESMWKGGQVPDPPVS